MDLGAGLVIGRVGCLGGTRRTAGPKVYEKLHRQRGKWCGNCMCQRACLCVNLFLVTTRTVRKSRQRCCIARKASGGTTVLCPVDVPFTAQAQFSASVKAREARFDELSTGVLSEHQI